MAVNLDVTATGLRVRFSGADLIAACSRGLCLPFNRILGIRVMTRSEAVASSPGLPCPGFSWPQHHRAGCWGIGQRRQLWSARRGSHVVVIYLTGRPFHRVVVEVDEPEQTHRRIDAALLHSKKSSARRSLRNHRPSATDRPDPDFSTARQRPQRHRPPSCDLDRVPARAAQPRRTDTGDQARHAFHGTTSAEPLTMGLQGPSGVGTRSGEPVPRVGDPAEHGRAQRRAAPDADDPTATGASPSGEIDPIVASRLRLYEYRARESARHRGGPGQPYGA